MENLSEYIIILSYMVFLSFSPGPNNILCSINGTRYGWAETIPLIIGMISGFFLVGFFTSLSVEFIKEQSEFLDSMKYICCLYLLYLSYLIMKEDPGTYTENTEALESPTQFKSGFVLQFINGKVIFYYIILMTVYAARLGSTYSIKFGLLVGASFDNAPGVYNSPPSGTGSVNTSELKELGELRASGIIIEAEFQKEKDKILGNR